MDLLKMTKRQLIDLILAYDNYIYNDGEEFNKDRQPVGISEFYDNEFQELEQ